MLSLISCTTYQNFMRFYMMVRILSLVKNPGMEPVDMILPLTKKTALEVAVLGKPISLTTTKKRNR